MIATPKTVDIMQSITKAAALAVALIVIGFGAANASDSAGSPHEFINSQDKSKAEAPSPTARNATGKRNSAGSTRVSAGPSGSVSKQIPSVSTSCLKPSLMHIIRGASNHFGSSAVITSGYRRGRHSYHGKCMAADVQIAGVSPGALAKYFRSQPGVGGVGTYGHTRSVHVDVAPRKYTWYHGRRRAG
jgi:uncharacterized protein YcbK (DUF882 family)